MRRPRVVTLRKFASRLLPNRSQQLIDSVIRLERKLDAELKTLQTAQRQSLKRVRRLNKDVRALAARLEDQQKDHARWETSTTWQVNALIRQAFLPADTPFPHKLAARRFKLRSQHEEDGYLLAL